MLKNGLVIISLFFLSMEVLYSQSVSTDETYSAKVVYFSGSEMYVTSELNVLVSKGDTLYLRSVDKTVMFSVVQSSSKYLLLHPLTAIIPLSIGQEIALFFTKEKLKTEAESIKAEKRESILNKELPSTRVKKKEIRIDGRVFIGMSAMQSSIKWNSTESIFINRFSAEPNSGLSLTASNLPGNWSIGLNSRFDYRYTDYRTIQPDYQWRVYQLQVEKKWEKLPITFRAGRFYNQNDSYSGFWDGLLVEFGNYTSGVGFIVGTEPTLSTDGFNYNQPKYSAYSFVSKNWKKLKSRTEFSVTHMEPAMGLVHNFLGMKEQVVFGKTRINISTQWDRNPNNHEWVNSYSYANVSQALSKSLQFTARYSHRQPFRFWSDTQPFGTICNQYGAGIIWSGVQYRMGADVFKNVMDSGYSSTALNSWLQRNDFSFLKLNVNLNSSIWFGNESLAVFGSTSFTKQWKSSWFQLGYQYNYSDYFNSTTQTHGIFTQIQKQIKYVGILSSRISFDYSSTMLRSALFISIWRTF